eukprot:gene31567-42091_t
MDDLYELTEVVDVVRFLGDKLDGYQKSNDEKLLSLRKDIDILSQHARNPRVFTTMETTTKSSSTEINKQRKTAYVFEESYMWHNPGVIRDSKWVEPMEFWENADTKRRLHNLVTVSGMLTNLIPLRARHATEEEITLFHTKEYFQSVKDQADKAVDGLFGVAGSYTAFAADGFKVACLRPPGHHAERDKGMGFCIFNNIAIA